MEKVDGIILETLADKIFTVERVSLMLGELKRRLDKNGDTEDVQQLTQQLELTQTKINRLYEAIENGIVSLDETLKDKVADLKRQKEQISAKIRYAQHSSSAHLDTISSSDVKRFCGLMRKRLLDTTSGYSKDYVKLLVKEIEVNKQDVVIRGNYGALVGAVKFAQKKETEHLLQSTRFRGCWLPSADSNHGHGG